MAETDGAVERWRMRWPLAVAIVVVALIGGAYYAYYRGQVAYYTGRNTRMLATLTNQIEGRISVMAGMSCGDEETRGIEEGARGLRVVLCKTSTPLSDIVRPIAARRVGDAFDLLLIASSDGKVIYSMRPPPRQSTLLKSQGEWIDDEYETTAAAPAQESANATRAAAEDRESESVVQITQLGALWKKKTWRVYENLDKATLAALTSATGRMNVRLNDTDYVLFTQPYAYVRARPNQPSIQWIVCGLVSSSRFRYDVSAISTSIILLAVGLLLLAICSWPFLRIALIDPSQAMTITDVILVVMCTIVGVAVLTLNLLDFFAYRRLSRTADDQIERFGNMVNRDFGLNIQRAVGALRAAERITRPMAAGAEPPSPTFPPAILNDAEIAKYPYLDSIAWIDGNGQQQVRMGRVTGAGVNVGDRKYFQLALQDRTESVNNVPYVLEWVRSRVSGEVRAVLAKKADPPAPDQPPPFPVVAIGTELIDVTHAVRPPGVGLAIIDENGEVIYHSDEERMGYENFFAETDRNKSLRSAVLARRSGHLTASYWGEDQSMFVRPLAGSRWTLVTYRPKRLTRVLNVEGALLTLVLLLLNSAPYLLVCIVVLLVAPGYRAPGVWPDSTRFGDYLRLCLILPGILLLFALTNYAMAPWSVFRGVVILPALSVATTYLILHRTASGRKFNIGLAVWIAIAAAAVAHLVTADFNTDALLHGDAARIVSIVIALATFALTELLLWRSKFGPRTTAISKWMRARFSYAGLYRLCGVLLLVIGVVMPVAGFFGISRYVETQLLVKYAQLRAAADLEHRVDHLETISVTPQPSANSNAFQRDVLGNKLSNVFDSDWRLLPPPPVLDPMLLRNPPPAADQRDDQTIPEWAATWLPALYEDSVAIRPLFEAGSADKLWTWTVNSTDKGPVTELTRQVHFDTDVAKRLWPPFGTTVPEQIIVRSSASRPAPAEMAPLFAVMAVLAAAMLALFWFIVDFIAKRVVLIDVTEPDWMLHRPLSPSLGDHVFLVRRRHLLSTLMSPIGKGLAFLDLSFEKIGDSDEQWNAKLKEIDLSEPGRNVRITDFEYKIDDVGFNKKKLKWLERLLTLPGRTVVLVSTVTPSYVLATPAPMFTEGYHERWRALLNRFACVTAEELELRHDEYVRRKRFKTVSQLVRHEPRTWLEKETEYNSFLRRLREELEQSSPDPSHLLDEIGERAETYYAGLWESCREEEKLMLCQLAQTGLANARNRRVLRRLIARGLVRRDPNLELFSETFRLYVLCAERRENVVVRAKEGRPASAWDSWRVPFFVVIISFLLLLFATQKDLMTTTTALATALTTGLPLVMKLLGVFTERRLGAPERS